MGSFFVGNLFDRCYSATLCLIYVMLCGLWYEVRVHGEERQCQKPAGVLSQSGQPNVIAQYKKAITEKALILFRYK